jgi:hypothetical protein
MARDFNIGVDLGLSGAITILTQPPFTKAITPLKIPLIGKDIDYNQLYKIFEPYKGSDVHVVFERLGVIFGTSKATAFSMGYQSGAIEMICIALALPYTKVPPKVWQKEMFQGVDEITRPGKSSRDTKAMALVAVKRLYPDFKLTFGDRAEKPHDGLIDSLLLAGFAQRKL